MVEMDGLPLGRLFPRQRLFLWMGTRILVVHRSHDFWPNRTV